MFNIGDKIRGTGCDIGGCEGIIIRKDDMGYAIELTKIGDAQHHGKGDWQVGRIIDRTTFWEDCIELITSFDEIKFRIGDKVRGQYRDTIYTGVIKNIYDDCMEVQRDDIDLLWQCKIRDNGEVAGANGEDDGIHNLQLISSDETNKRRTIKMKLNNMMKRLLDADTKKLIQGNIINGDLELTQRGKDALDAINFLEKKAELVKVAEENIKEQKEEEDDD